jgi:hypothetical protein
MSELILKPQALKITFDMGGGSFAHLKVQPRGSMHPIFNESYFGISVSHSELLDDMGMLPSEPKETVSFTDSALNLTSNRKLRKTVVKTIHEECENTIVAQAIIAIIHLYL